MAQSTLPLSFAPLEGITGWLFRRVHHSRFPGLARYYTPFSAPTADSPLTGRGPERCPAGTQRGRARGPPAADQQGR